MLPTSLYIHTPWCIRKCPYCDFNSHKAPLKIDEMGYIERLLTDFKEDLKWFGQRTIQSIFIGGGTPSLFSAASYNYLFEQLSQLTPFAESIEITLEANPGTVEQERFNHYRKAGINRLSLGIQSFNAKHLLSLGRIHGARQAHQAIEAARYAGFENINLDLMYGLPQQTVKEGLTDLELALEYKPEHLSWYQLTIEPNTVFYKKQPDLPNEDIIFQLEQEGLTQLTHQGLLRYEISAFCQPKKPSYHNLNYWLFGDYYGIGAGAHGKLTGPQGVYRTIKQRQPHHYNDTNKLLLAAKEMLNSSSLIFEFMLNTTRLEQTISSHLFSNRTGLSFELLKPLLEKAAEKNLIALDEDSWKITALGRRYTNDLQALFLPT